MVKRYNPQITTVYCSRTKINNIFFKTSIKNTQPLSGSINYCSLIQAGPSSLGGRDLSLKTNGLTNTCEHTLVCCSELTVSIQAVTVKIQLFDCNGCEGDMWICMYSVLCLFFLQCMEILKGQLFNKIDIRPRRSSLGTTYKWL